MDVCSRILKTTQSFVRNKEYCRATSWVDGSYDVHWNSKGHTGATMSMGKGAIVNVSRRHKLNAGSSTESELVSIADVLGLMIWCKYFMDGAGLHDWQQSSVSR